MNHPDINVIARDNLNDTTLHKIVKFQKLYSSDHWLNLMQQLLNHSFIRIHEKNIENKTPFDMIKDNMYKLNDKNYQHDASEEDILSCFIKMNHLLEEFLIKQRWQVYCYHVKVMDNIYMKS